MSGRVDSVRLTLDFAPSDVPDVLFVHPVAYTSRPCNRFMLRRVRNNVSVIIIIIIILTAYGDRCFAVAGPRVWNSLPTEVRQSDSLGQFKRRLKTHLFGLWDHSTTGIGVSFSYVYSFKRL